MTSVLIVVFDGLQPAQVRPDLMPNLSRFADEGVFFENHHPGVPIGDAHQRGEHGDREISGRPRVGGQHDGGEGL